MRKVVKKLGFTLIELLVVIAIIGILSSVVLASISSARKKAAAARFAADMKNLHTAIIMYKEDNNGVFESSNSQVGWDDSYGSNSLNTYLESKLVPDYIPEIPHYSTYPNNLDEVYVMLGTFSIDYNGIPGEGYGYACFSEDETTPTWAEWRDSGFEGAIFINNDDPDLFIPLNDTYSPFCYDVSGFGDVCNPSSGPWDFEHCLPF